MGRGMARRPGPDVCGRGGRRGGRTGRATGAEYILAWPGAGVDDVAAMVLKEPGTVLTLATTEPGRRGSMRAPAASPASGKQP